MIKTFKFHTLGCKVNQYETQLMREQLLKCGLQETCPVTNTGSKDISKICNGENSNTPVDLYIVNTCTVTSDADRESRRFIRHSIRENPNAVIIAAGCYIEKDAEVIRAIDEKIIILPNKEKGNIAKYINHSPINHSPINRITHFKDHTKAFIKIQDGCDNFCSYCKVPYVRGEPTSRDKDDIINEARELIKNNYKELVLTGVCLGAYGKDLTSRISLKDILVSLAAMEGDFRIRLSSIEIQDVSDAVIDVIKKNNKICNHLHIPLQSGDDGILNKMNRKYSREEFLRKIKVIRKNIPGLAISTDVIIGFPGETKKAFNSTIKALKKIDPMRTHIFSYSRRPYTAAFGLKGELDKETIAERYKAIKAITEKMAKDYAKKAAKIKHRVLVENTKDKNTHRLCGYTDTYIRVTLKGPDELMGKFIIARPNTLCYTQ
ncbi:MAG: tRNA (N(6)-L-threonylcarbamoyladenosine(37)-C(2))-methylthiotransferase MtaB [Candidatus Omnitrophota bacterium]